MKIFKKITASLLALLMSFSFFACDGMGTDDSSSIFNGDSSNSQPDSSSGNEDVGTTGEGEKYLEGIVNSIRSAQTITMNITMSTTDTFQDNDYGSEEDTFNDSHSDTVSLSGSVVLSQTSDGYNMMFELESKETYVDFDDNPDNYEYSDTVTGYIVDGFIYGFNEDMERWEKIDIEALLEYKENADESESASFALITAFESMAELYNMFMTGDFTEMYKALGPIFEQTIVVENNAFVFELDIVEEVKDAIDYIKNIDYKQTIETYVNSILASLGAEVTIADILAEIATYGDYTVGQAYDAISALIREETGLTMNEFKNKLIEELDLSMLEGYLSEEEYQMVISSIQSFKAVDLDEMVNPYREMTVNDILNMMFAGPNTEGGMEYMTVMEEPAITLEYLIAQISEMIKTMTLEDVVTSIGLTVEMIITELSYLSIDKLASGVSLRFNGYAISSIELTENWQFSYNNPTSYSESITLASSVKISLSNETTTITPPADAVLVNPYE